MELREIETFLVLSEELHFGRTAGRLGITGGRVSQLISRLEREIGAPLFERTSRRVTLTPLGERFRFQAGRAFEELLAALHDAQLSVRKLSGRLRVGYLPSIGGEIAAEIAAAFETEHPECTVVLKAIGVNEAIVADGISPESDVALVWSPGGDGQALAAPGLTVGPVLGYAPRGLLVPAGHPLADRRTVCLDDLVDYPLIQPVHTAAQHARDLWTPRFTGSGRPLRHTTDDMIALTGRLDVRADDMLMLVSRGAGLHCTVATLLDRIPGHDLAMVEITDMPPMAAVLTWRTSSENALVRAFARTAHKVVTGRPNPLRNVPDPPVSRSPDSIR